MKNKIIGSIVFLQQNHRQRPAYVIIALKERYRPVYHNFYIKMQFSSQQHNQLSILNIHFWSSSCIGITNDSVIYRCHIFQKKWDNFLLAH